MSLSVRSYLAALAALLAVGLASTPASADDTGPECLVTSAVDLVYPQAAYGEEEIVDVPPDAVLLVSIAGACGHATPALDSLAFELSYDGSAEVIKTTTRPIDSSVLLASSHEMLLEIVPARPLRAASVFSLRSTTQHGDPWTFATGTKASAAPVTPSITFDEVSTEDYEGDEDQPLWVVDVRTKRPSAVEGALFLQLRAKDRDEPLAASWARANSKTHVDALFFDPPDDGSDACVVGYVRAPNGAVSPASAPSCFAAPGCAIAQGVGASRPAGPAGIAIGLSVAAAWARKRRGRTKRVRAASAKLVVAPRLVTASLALALWATASLALAQPAPEAPPDGWFPTPARGPDNAAPVPPAAPPARTGPDSPPAPSEGAYVISPPVPALPPPPPPPPLLPPDEEYVNDEGELLMAILSVRAFVTRPDNGPLRDDPESIVGGQVGFRAHGIGIDDDLIGRGDLEGFIGASSEDIDGEGQAFLAVGLAYPLASRQHVMFRFGGGGSLRGTPLFDYQVADLPSLELGYVHTGPEAFEVAPRVAMGVLHMVTAGARDLEPDPAPAVGGRVVAGGDHLWGMFDYEVITTEEPFHVGALTACYANKLSFCVDARLASGSLDFGGGISQRVTPITAGLSIGVGDIDTKD